MYVGGEVDEQAHGVLKSHSRTVAACVRTNVILSTTICPSIRTQSSQIYKNKEGYHSALGILCLNSGYLTAFSALIKVYLSDVSPRDTDEGPRSTQSGVSVRVLGQHRGVIVNDMVKHGSHNSAC